ncbi:hypothetical protein NMY22_g7046 [Coprinellus aureogranulatus]|nr:hypothetical protein NMY22_g7046 [Coprinellus aureogranulatus]
MELTDYRARKSPGVRPSSLRSSLPFLCHQFFTMPHADSAFLPDYIQTKSEFWDHVHSQLEALLEGQRCRICRTLPLFSTVRYSPSPNTSAIQNVQSTGQASCTYTGICLYTYVRLGFYIRGDFFPTPRISGKTPLPNDQLLLGPFCGKPACQFIPVAPGKERGVCAAAYVKQQTIVVPDVEAYPGHIACDGETKSEIVCPLILEHDSKVTLLGVLDLDCLALNGFGEEDRVGLEKIAKLVVNSSDW